MFIEYDHYILITNQYNIINFIQNCCPLIWILVLFDLCHNQFGFINKIYYLLILLIFKITLAVTDQCYELFVHMYI